MTASVNLSPHARQFNILQNRLSELDEMVERNEDAVFAGRNNPVIVPNTSTSRFSNDTNTAYFVDKMKNVNTKRKTDSDIRLFQSYLDSIGNQTTLEYIPPQEMDTLLARFFLNVRKTDGSEYEPGTLHSFHSSVHRYLSEKQYGCNIMSDDIFKHSRDVLQAKKKLLKSQGKGNKDRAAQPLTQEEVSILYESGQLGTRELLFQLILDLDLDL